MQLTTMTEAQVADELYERRDAVLIVADLMSPNCVEEGTCFCLDSKTTSTCFKLCLSLVLRKALRLEMDRDHVFICATITRQ